MPNSSTIFFDHSHHLLSVQGSKAPLDVLAFEGHEALSKPFSYRIEFTSGDHAISKEMMLMKAASLTLQAPVDQGYGIRVQQAVRVIQGGVIDTALICQLTEKLLTSATQDIRVATYYCWARLHQDGEAGFAEGLASRDVVVKPGGDANLNMPMEEDAQFVAVAGLFRHPDMVNNTWKQVIERDDLDPDKPRILEAGNNHLTLQPLKDD